ncbi:hypothetical protein HanRHA438_Chr02g0083651 [Helianthus annuus]|nr:hypothetical protein HanRHA438_Chr02g0083651 [Helianthus annuus]
MGFIGQIQQVRFLEVSVWVKLFWVRLWSRLRAGLVRSTTGPGSGSGLLRFLLFPEE